MAEVPYSSDFTSDELGGWDQDRARHYLPDMPPVNPTSGSMFPPAHRTWPRSWEEAADQPNTGVLSASYIAGPTPDVMASFTSGNSTSSRAINQWAQDGYRHGPPIPVPWTNPAHVPMLEVDDGTDAWPADSQVTLPTYDVDWPRPTLTAEGGFRTLRKPLTVHRHSNTPSGPANRGSTASSPSTSWSIQHGPSEIAGSLAAKYRIHTHCIPGCPKATTYSIELEHGGSPGCLAPGSERYASLQQATSALKVLEEAGPSHFLAAEGLGNDATLPDSCGQIAPEWIMTEPSNPTDHIDSDETADRLCHVQTSDDISCTNARMPNEPAELRSPAIAAELNPQSPASRSTAEYQAEARARRRPGRRPHKLPRGTKESISAKISRYFEFNDGRRCHDSASKATGEDQLAHGAVDDPGVTDKDGEANRMNRMTADRHSVSGDRSTYQGRVSPDGGERGHTSTTMSDDAAARRSGNTIASLGCDAVEKMHAPYDATCISLRSLPKEGKSYPVMVTFLSEHGRPVENTFKVSSSQHLSKLLHTEFFALSMCTGRDPRDDKACLRSLPSIYTAYCRSSEKPYYAYDSKKEAQNDFGEDLLRRARLKLKKTAALRPVLLRWRHDQRTGESGQTHEVLLTYNYVHRTKTGSDQIRQLWERLDRDDCNQLGTPTKPPPLWTLKPQI